MYQYAVLSSLGDDVYEEPSTIRLQNHVAKLFGKEAALFVSSGSMSNQIALRAHLTQPPHSILCDARAHINWYFYSSFTLVFAFTVKCSAMKQVVRHTIRKLPSPLFYHRMVCEPLTQVTLQ